MHNPGWSRREFLKRTMFAGGLVAAPGLLTACAQQASGGLEELQSAGSITLGIAGEEPYAYRDGGKLTGAIPEVHKAIWNNLGIDTIEAEQVAFDGLIPGLNAQRFNVVAAGMFITPERCQQAEFADPTYCAPNAFLVPQGNPDDLSDFKSVADAGVKIAVLGGAVEGTFAKANGVAGGNVVVVGSTRDGLLQVQQGRVGALALTTITLNNALKDNPSSKLELTEPFIPEVDGEPQNGCGAAVFRQDDDSLREAYNEELAKLKQSGELVKIMEPFGFGEETVPPDDITTEQLCG
ncbi:MAG: ectoine/hydroxyectoine ABC transporter substrate-binding protein EhuB [Nocardioidaceae bacterium]